MSSIEDIRRTQADLQRMKAEFRKRAGITPEELARIGGTSNVNEVTALSVEVERVRQERQRKAA
jgi:hypothetical protein